MMMRERARQWLRPLMLALCVEGRGLCLRKYGVRLTHGLVVPRLLPSAVAVEREGR